VHDANAQQLRCDFDALVWKEAENTEDFPNRITRLAANLHLLGDNIIDVKVVRNVLLFIPEHLSQVAMSIETLLDINTILWKRLAANLHLLGDNIIDVEVVRNMLLFIPEHLSQVAISIETLLDINTILWKRLAANLHLLGDNIYAKRSGWPSSSSVSQGSVDEILMCL
jgi:hypothetical protein